MRSHPAGRTAYRRARRIRRTAEGLGVDERSVWRWLAQDGDAQATRRRYVLTEDDIDGFYDWRGNIAALRRARLAAGAPSVPPLRTSAVVLASLRRGIVVDPARGPFGGLPEKLVPDNGLEFVAAALRRSCAALGVELAPTPSYQGYSKGKVERVNRTLDQEFLSGLPFHTHGPRAADGHLFGPDVAPMGLGLFCELFADWVTSYNTERVHSELGATPLARWSMDATRSASCCSA